LKGYKDYFSSGILINRRYFTLQFAQNRLAWFGVGWFFTGIIPVFLFIGWLSRAESGGDG
jgi:hypothetical protein